MKKIFDKVIDRIFWKFILVGIVNTIVGTGVMFVFYNVFHFNYWISTMSNYIVGSMVSYFLNRVFTFQNKEKTIKTLFKFTINISFCYFIAYGVAKPLTRYVMSSSSTKVQENIAMLVGMCIFVLLNYCGQRFFVFGYEREKDAKGNSGE